jgi:hypothetical protein
MKSGRCTVFEEQQVNEKGLIEGGLASFAEAEFENLKTLLGGLGSKASVDG